MHVEYMYTVLPDILSSCGALRDFMSMSWVVYLVSVVKHRAKSGSSPIG